MGGNENHKIGFKKYELPCSFGTVDVICNPFRPQGTAVLGPFDDKELGPKLYHATDSLVEVDDLDGLLFQRSTSSDNRIFTGRVWFYGNYILPAPGEYFRTDDLPTS